MPFRKLPNSDKQRTSALNSAVTRYEATTETDRLYPPTLHDPLVALHTEWTRKAGERDIAAALQGTETAQAEVARLRLEQFVSHYFQVFQLGVARGDFERADRTFYGLDFSQTDIPTFSTHEDLVLWARHIVDGDAARTAAKPKEPAMALPKAAEVGTALATYLIEHTDQSAAGTAQAGVQDEVAVMRPNVDALIREVWDTIEFNLRHEPGPDRRRMARAWGIVYVPRPGEAPDPAPSA
ncbi:MAG: hypothetical protein ABI680_13430 [Chthoniobacteraceae bacterium]